MRIHVQNDPTDPMPVTPAEFDAAAARAGAAGLEVSYGDSPPALAEGIARAEVLVTTPSEIVGQFPPGHLDQAAPELKMIFCTAAGMDKLAPFDWLPPRVALLNNRGVHAAKAFEYALMALTLLNTGLPAMIAAQQAGRWAPHHAPTLRGRQVAIIGTGALGSACARAARLCGCTVTGLRTLREPHPDFDRIATIDALDSILPLIDVLILACPLTPATRNLLDRRRLTLLPRGAALINIGRGGLVDQNALCDHLDSERLAGAVLDVFTPEPIPPGHRLWTTRNLVITPHAAVDDPVRYNPDSLDLLFRNLAAWRAGETMPNSVDLARGY